MDFRADIEGADKINAVLKERFGGVRGRVVDALTTLAAETRDQAARAAPVGATGRLRASIKARVQSAPTVVLLKVWAKKQTSKKKNYARFVEYGTLNRQAISSIRELKNKGRAAQFRMYQHQRAAGAFRTRAQPFMEPARATMRSRVTGVLQGAIEQGLEG